MSYDTVDFVWLLPHAKYFDDVVFGDFMKKFEVNSSKVISGRISNILKTRIYLKEIINEREYKKVALVGTTSRFFYFKNSKEKVDWFINGVPEERLIHDNSPTNKLRVRAFWYFTNLFKEVDQVVAVSSYMAEYLRNKVNANGFYFVPSGIYHLESKLNVDRGLKMVYSGSGAPWQWIKRLSLLWRMIHEKEPDVEFLVISRDKRCVLLKEGIDPKNIQFKQAENGEDVFLYMQEGVLGFLIREENIVNHVSFPIKFGEYLAAGLNVIVSDFNWSCADFIKKNGGGLLVDNDDIQGSVNRIIEFYKGLDKKSELKAIGLSKSLRFDNSQQQLIQIIRANF
ncbi:glycosyltransferase [Algoriphagus resistens]|uniref:glycosyltransferase n=1 Tax=Algoriphagus resistens TaxID=1750590 RepID=UPI000716B770|nr:glycosyltransferase [Algoriphagus resistens]